MFYDHLIPLPTPAGVGPEDTGGIRFFKTLVKQGDLSLSVQASTAHYCTPRQFLTDLSEYTAWEVAIGFGGSCTHPSNVQLDLPDELAQIWGGDTVAPYTPTSAVQELYEFFLRLQEGEVPKKIPAFFRRFDTPLRVPDDTLDLSINTRIFDHEQ